jgi:hypothetical protein
MVLPEGIRHEVEDFGDGRGGATAEPEAEGFGPDAPGRTIPCSHERL